MCGQPPLNLPDQQPLSGCCKQPPAVIMAILPTTNPQKKAVDDANPSSCCIFDEDDDDDLKRLPSPSEVVRELRKMGGIAGPMVCLGLLLYGRMATSMYYLGRLGEAELAGGSLAIGLANITCYSVLSGLALGMEPICGQAYGAKEWEAMGLALQRTILMLLCFCVPIAGMWLNMQRMLVWCGQDEGLSSMAATYLLYSLPDLVAQAVLNPLRIYLRTQTITTPLTVCTSIALLLHLFLNHFLVTSAGLGIRGVALAAAATDFNLLLLLLLYLRLSGLHRHTWTGWSPSCLRHWKPLLLLSLPSCLSVCLEWWWYELMIVFSSFLPDAQSTVAAMGILIQTTSLVYIFPSSLSLAVSTRVANELGAHRPAAARFSMIVALFCAAALALAAMAFTVTMRHAWGAIFTADPHILSLVAVAMPVVGLCELGNCPQTAGCGALRGSARPSTAANINLGSFYMVGLPVALLLALKIGFVGLWFGLLAAQATCAALMLYVLVNTDWSLQAARAKQLTASLAAQQQLSNVAQMAPPDSNAITATVDYLDPNGFKVEAQELERLISIKLEATQ